MRLISIPNNSVPDAVEVGRQKTSDGVLLRYAVWKARTPCRGTVCVLQGRAEFIEKYFETVRDLQARGFAVASFDWRGQGLSERIIPNRLKGHINDFYEYDVDLHTFMENVVLPNCPRPILAIGHSMGAAVLMRGIRDGNNWFDLIVLSAPLMALAVPLTLAPVRGFAHLMRVIGFGSSYVPGGNGTAIGLRPFAHNLLTSDPIRHARTAAILHEEPKLGIASPTIGWMDAALRATAEFSKQNFAATVLQPALVVTPANDKLISTEAAAAFARQLPAGSHIVVNGARHELLMERDSYRLRFWTAFDKFVLQNA